jgi:hypothetical protein
VSDSTISNNFEPVSHGGANIIIRPSGSGQVRAVIDRARLEKSGEGVETDAPGAGLANVVHIRDSAIARNSSGVVAFSPAGTGIVSITVDRTSSTLTAGAGGIFSSGPTSFVVLGRSTVIGNTIGLNPTNGGSIFSYQNNHLTGNSTDGAPTGTLTLK